MGTIVIPVFIERSDNAKSALEASDFKPIWEVLEALKSHDERLSDELDQLRIELGAKRKRSVGADDLTKIVFDLPTSVDAGFASSLRAHLVEQTTESWMFWYGLLQTFCEQHRHSRVPFYYKTDEGYRLGSWINKQRTDKGVMEVGFRQLLEALPGWSWNVLDYQWEEGFSHLQAFLEREGHCRVPAKHKTEKGYRLGAWVNYQRTNRQTVDFDRQQRLEALRGWSWDVLTEQWEKGFSHLKQFSEHEGYSRVGKSYKTQNGYGLGRWITKQRGKKETMEPSRRERLEALPGWSWDARSDNWEKGFSHLKEFCKQNSHCRVPAKFTTSDGYKLGGWVRVQRQAESTLEPSRRQRLAALPGWSWDVWTEQWEEGFSHLQTLLERKRHCRVGARYKTSDGYPLGAWIRRNRAAKRDLDSDRRQRLEALQGWSWDPYSDSWEVGFTHLQTFLEREGHCRVSQSYKTHEGYRLGFWVSNQRATKDQMSLDRRKRLEALPGWSWNARHAKWEDGFSHLTQFVTREGHCLVPADYRTDDGYRLGQWVSVQRYRLGILSRRQAIKDETTLDRQQRLEVLPGWVWNFKDR